MGAEAKRQESFVSVYLMMAGNWKTASKFIFQKQLKSSLMVEGCFIYDFLPGCQEEERENPKEESKQTVLKASRIKGALVHINY